ncbi:MAG: efflux RND transporter periplasmic adaptor subunit [Candidatus Omnitrophica bacterium]|nr:efflux RND transporter periplasmic adaptor subunit [Candidatus Omnitrophota bacterium]
MKKSKRLLIGFILLWVIGFAVIWGLTLLKKSPDKNIGLPDMLSGNKEQAATAEPGQAMPDGLSSANQAVSVRCYRVAAQDFRDDLPVMGLVKGSLEITLKFEINGIIQEINFREGDVIYKKDLIAVLDKKDAQLKVDYAQSKLDSAKTQELAALKKLEIHESLYKIGGIIKVKLEEVQLEAKSAGLQVESAKVELESANAELGKTNLLAPRDGVLGSRDSEVGEFVTPNDKMATLYDIMEVFVDLGIVEKDIDKIALGQPVTVTVDAYPGMTFNGITDNVFPLIEGKSRTLTVRVRIKNEDAMLLPGMFARAMITVAEFSNAIVVPSVSLNKTDQGYQLFVVNENNEALSRTVDVAYVTTDYTVIASGLSEGDIVVVDTPQELKDGMPVNIVEIQEPASE